MLPRLIVFDLDMCAWSPEMYTLSEIPKKTIKGDLNGHGHGVVAAVSDGEHVRLFPGALHALQQLHLNKLPGTKCAVASSADTPHAVKIAKKCLQLLEVVPGVSVAEVLRTAGGGFGHDGNIQIGRSPPLSSNKSKTHFPRLRDLCEIDYEHMLFFDDSNWEDNCAIVERHCPGVVAQRTPRGLQVHEFELGLRKFAERKSA